jgi:uncharacterized DUF497 family protein
MFIGFEWDKVKELENLHKHGVDFATAQQAFGDPLRIIRFDLLHSFQERRYFCYGKVGVKILTVRFTLRHNKVRIIGAAYWRAGKAIYEKANG